ncbi:hypothetical protein DICPUDRAFT_52193 [Dictyostelium purpureum]|uniref:Protein DD3-3 n=1 Tax=Dictyostelium purpureum TaxID=5786 RepID=F0Z7D6_DICPU|nr:uncharacterized protein DICPUDRAFT_52193 [Dictyostelium purpureum]EGC40159.1 hypothetical protein DICPUDRAFT_52193 [Dictyostelium purpureum]|eukprot:XP_003283349.1 hypothetical protein DICPUDRAFT_52193 [Dictyostelium purpureum]
MNKKILLVLFIIVSVVYADIYGHAPPFSNNRNQETGQNRDNAQRLFNTQNNAKGGYCRGDALEWYEGSILPVQWTVQHGCGSDETECNIVIQYMCTDSATAAPWESIRDGTNTNTIGNTLEQAVEKVENTDTFVYGLHESYYYYQNCTKRQRNRGLFTANQLDPNNNQNADRTRQSNGGTRYGYECQEERDYYPYWAPSPWKDVAVITDNKDLCKYYQSESQNVKSKYYCANSNQQFATIDPKQCANEGTWTEVPSHGIGKPSCHKAEWTAVNHLGHTLHGGAPATFNWTLPGIDQEPCIKTGTCQCVLRIRYNISTSDIKGYGDEFTDYRDNKNTSVSYNDPNIELSPGNNVTININPNQYGRTFQDRTHVFRIKARTPELRGKKIWNLLVKGKRGNIVNSYPAQEYMFVPHALKIKKNEYIHFQWTGCDYNPQGNDGSGRKGTDRSNMVQIKSLNHNIPLKDDELGSKPLFTDKDVRLKFALLDQTGCKSYEDLLATNANDNDIEQDPQNCMYLNAAPTRFDGGARKMSNTGTYYYMSTRNNNFSNRNQKGSIIVEPLLAPWQIGLIAAGCSLFVIIAAVGGTVAFARFHPHSGANRVVSKVPGLKKLV